MEKSNISRRAVLQVGGVASLAAAMGLAAGQPASASASLAAKPKATEVLDLGPGVVQFSLMSGLLVGETLYIGSRNLDPVRIVAFHVPSGKVTGVSELENGYAIQTLAADAAGRYLYAGVLQNTTGPKPNLFRWDLSNLGAKATPVGRIGDRDVRDLSVAPNGRLYAVGGGSGTAPALWEYDPATGTVALKARFPNRDRQLWPGQFVNVRLKLQTLHGAQVIPLAAVNQGPNGAYAYVVDAHNKVSMRPIKVTSAQGTTVVVGQGLKPGEVVVTDGQMALKAGMTVQARPSTRLASR